MISKQAYKKHKQVLEWWSNKPERQVWQKYDYMTDITYYYSELNSPLFAKEIDKLDIKLIYEKLSVEKNDLGSNVKSTITLLGSEPNLNKIIEKIQSNSIIQKKTNWFLKSKPTWNVENTYVENDIFSEIRKEYFNGDIIEYFDKQSQKWNQLEPDKNSLTLNYEISYRNANRHFNIGDYVIYNDTICKIKSKESYYASIESAKSVGKAMMCKLIKWKPSIGEKCLFWNENEEIKIIGKLDEIINKDHRRKIYTIQCDNTHFKKNYDNIAPLSLIHLNL